MPAIPVNSDGTVLYYEDSGVPQGKTDYSTIVILHELIFHSATFRVLFPQASSHNLRLITVNFRDYPTTSLLNERKINNLRSQESEQQGIALLEQVIELAMFLVRLIEAEDIPPPECVAPDSDRKVGGTSLIAWSQSNGHLLSLLSNTSLLNTGKVPAASGWLFPVISHTACPFVAPGKYRMLNPARIICTFIPQVYNLNDAVLTHWQALCGR